jgi:hypothetical protein
MIEKNSSQNPLDVFLRKFFTYFKFLPNRSIKTIERVDGEEKFN